MTKISVNQLASFTGHKSGIYTLEKAGEASIFYSSGGDGMMVEWNAAAPEKGQVRATVPNQVFSMLRLPEKQLLLLGQLQGGIHLLDQVKHQEIKLLQAHASAVFQIFRLKNQPGYFFSIGGDGRLLKWNTAQMAVEKHIQVSAESLRVALFLPKSNLLAIGASDNHIYLLDADTLTIKHQFKAHDNSVFALTATKDEKYLISGSRDAHIRVWKLSENCEFCHSIPAHLFTVNDLAISPDGKWLISGSRDKTIKIWDADTFEILKVIDKDKFKGHVNSVNRLCWLNNTTFISAGDDRAIILWQINENQ
ncbi:MAG: WD40 repeat domain-containing protein [Chitinophagales bacterium]